MGAEIDLVLEKGGKPDEQGEQKDPGRYPPEEVSPGFLFTIDDRGQGPAEKTKHTGRCLE